jgi:hypothetical protein
MPPGYDYKSDPVFAEMVAATEAALAEHEGNRAGDGEVAR